jgi:hypothetical protein
MHIVILLKNTGNIKSGQKNGWPCIIMATQGGVWCLTLKMPGVVMRHKYATGAGGVILAQTLTNEICMTIRLPPAHFFFHVFQPVQRLMQNVVLPGKVKAYQAVHVFLKKTGAGNCAHADPFSQFFAKIRMRKVSPEFSMGEVYKSKELLKMKEPRPVPGTMCVNLVKNITTEGCCPLDSLEYHGVLIR